MESRLASTLIALSLLALALASVGSVKAQTETTTVTTTPIVVSFENVTVFKFNVTVVSFGYINRTTLIVSYTCQYATTPDEDCVYIGVEFYNGTELKESFSIPIVCHLESICSYVTYVNIANYSKIHVKLYDLNKDKLLAETDIPIPYAGPSLSGYLSFLYILIPVGLIGGLAARGSIKMIGIGFVLLGVVFLLLPYIGIYPPNQYAVFTVSIIIGIILLWFSER